MSGELVIVRAFGGRAHVREVLEWEGESAVLCRPGRAEAIRSGAEPMPVIGFRKGDLYAYDAKAAQRIQEGKSVDWAKMKPVVRTGASAG